MADKMTGDLTEYRKRTTYEAIKAYIEEHGIDTKFRADQTKNDFLDGIEADFGKSMLTRAKKTYDAALADYEDEIKKQTAAKAEAEAMSDGNEDASVDLPGWYEAGYPYIAYDGSKYAIKVDGVFKKHQSEGRGADRNGNLLICGGETPVIVKKLVDIGKPANDANKCVVAACVTDAHGESTYKEYKVPKKTLTTSKDFLEYFANSDLIFSESTIRDMTDYFRDLLVRNKNTIPTVRSVTQPGWTYVDGDMLFVPYECDGYNFVYDDTESIVDPTLLQSHGSEKIWNNEAVRILSSGRSYINVMFYAALASVLVSFVEGYQSTVFDLHNYSGNGKTILLNFCASVWGKVSKIGGSSLIKNFANTGTSIELLAGQMRNLPLYLDDSKNMDKRQRESIDNLIMLMRNGESKGRANKEIKMRAASRWANFILTTGEYSLHSMVTGGGTRNGIISVPAPRKIWDAMDEEIAHVMEVISSNYGFFGPKFIRTLKKIGLPKVKDIIKEETKRLKAYCKDHNIITDDKQINPLGLVLTAEKIVAEHMLATVACMDIDYVAHLTMDAGDIDEGKRAYDYLMQIIVSNYRTNFCKETAREMWGTIHHYKGDPRTYANLLDAKLKYNILGDKYSYDLLINHCRTNDLVKVDDKATGAKAYNAMHANSVRPDGSIGKGRSVAIALDDATIKMIDEFNNTHIDVPPAPTAPGAKGKVAPFDSNRGRQMTVGEYGGFGPLTPDCPYGK